MMGEEEAPLALTPLRLILTSDVAPVCKSRTKTSDALFVSPGTRSLALLLKATKRPSALIVASREELFPEAVPEGSALTSTVLPAGSTRTNTSGKLFASLGTRSSAELTNATRLPSALADRGERVLGPSGVWQGRAGSCFEIRSVMPASR